MRTVAGSGQAGGKGHGSRKQPSTVTAQFQQSLQSLLVTLNQANPFFIRCIKSNLQKVRRQEGRARREGGVSRIGLN